jgi:hypothetical protein
MAPEETAKQSKYVAALFSLKGKSIPKAVPKKKEGE